MLATPCPDDVAGFPCDEELQRLRRSWWESTDEAERARLADQIQVRAYQVAPFINGGQRRQYTAVRTIVSGLGGDDGAGILGGGEGGLAT
jgi:peptide/nickel transport system substrate-binding protein